jgi:hypothetical protein
MQSNYLITLEEKGKSRWASKLGDTSFKQDFYFLLIYGNKSSDRKAKPSVRMGQKATGL